MKIASIVGARPQFIKLAPLVRALHSQASSKLSKNRQHIIIHTGQHYDYEMNKVFFDQLEIPKPDYNLEVGSGPHGWQTGMMLRRTEAVLIDEKPGFVLVFGDTNSTLAVALAATKLHTAVAHVESGLRSYNRRMPEEINRIMTDRCSDVLFCPTENAVKNLIKEGVSNVIQEGKLTKLDAIESLPVDQKTPFAINVGDIMYDAVFFGLDIAETKSNILDRLRLEPKKYYLATIHRADNTDDRKRLKSILDSFEEISADYPVIFPVHPRTKKNMLAFNLFRSPSTELQVIDPVSYFDMLILEKNAKKILTDSGGMQKEAYFFQVPCVTLRDETEWVETQEDGYNILTGADKEKICAAALSPARLESSPSMPFGDGRTAERIVRVLSRLQHE